MDIKRFFSSDSAKGTVEYIKIQKKYEIIRTLFFFAISASLFIAGYITTGTKRNLLTIVAVLGFLPASKSLVNTIMFLKFKGCAKEIAEKTLAICKDNLLFDLVFTTYDINYEVDVMYIGENEIIGFSDKKSAITREKDFTDYLTKSLSNDGIKGYTIKIFDDYDKFADRLKTKSELNESVNMATVASILSVIL